MNRSNERALAFCGFFAHASSVLAIIIGFSVIAGWSFQIQFLKTLALNDATMKPNTAAGFILMGVALWVLTRQMHRTASQGQVLLARVCAAVAAFVGGLALVEYLFGVDLDIHQALFPEAQNADKPYSSRMPLVASLNCLFLGAALLLLLWPRRQFTWLAQVLVLLAGLSALIAFAAHFFLSEVLRQTLPFFNIAPHASLTLAVTACGILCVSPRDGAMALFTADSAGGSVIRRLLLPVTLLPVMLNWLEFSLERQALFPVGFLWVLDAALTVFVLGLLVWKISMNLHLKDKAAQSAEADLRSSEERYRQLVEMSPDGILVESDGRIELANRAMTHLLGAQGLTDVVGEPLAAFIHPDLRTKVETELRGVMAVGVSLPLTPVKVMRLDGTSLDVEVAASHVEFHGRRVAQIVVRDVSERKRAEEELHQSIERFQLVARATNDAVWDWDITTNVAWWNDAFFQQFGYDPNTTPSFEAWIARIHPDDTERVTSRFTHVLETRDGVWTDEYRLKLADGSYGYVYDRGYILRGPEGKPFRMLGAIMDITKRKQAEQALQESEERFRLIAETVNEVFWMADPKIEKLVYLSPAYQRIWGRTCASLYKSPRSFLDAIHPEDRERVMTGLEVQKAGRPFTHEYRIIRPDGTMRWIWDRGFPVRTGVEGTLNFVGVAQDITERKQAEGALHQSEERFRRLAENAQDIVYRFEFRPGRRLAYISPAVTKITGYTPQEHYADPDLWFKVVHPEDRSFVEAAMRGEFKPDSTVEFRWFHKNGSVIWTEQRNVAVYDTAGNILAIEGIARDITERITSETALREQKELLQTIVDNIPVMIVFISSQGRTEWVNREWIRVLGWSLEETQSRDILPDMYPDPVSRRAVLDFALNPRPGWGDFRTHTKDRRVIDTMWANVLISDGRRIGIGQDITERTQMDRALRITANRLRILSLRLLQAQENERREIARELHDEIGQALTAVEMTLQALLDSVSSDAERARLEESLGIVSTVLDQVRDLSLNLRPSMLDDLGLVPTLQWYVDQQHKRTGVHIELRVQDRLPRFNPALETACYRIVQEALTNVVRHAQARWVSIEIQQNGDQLTLRVRDDGRGFDVAAIRQQIQRGASFGLLGMQERATLLGGSMEIKSAPGKGAEINAWLPIEPPGLAENKQDLVEL